MSEARSSRPPVGGDGIRAFLALVALVALAAVLVSACTASTEAVYGEEEVIVLDVAPERVRCVGEMEDMCLQVRAPDEEEWRKFYDPIEGFRHEEGVRYTLEVGRREILNAPADDSAYAYRLLRILDQERVGG